MKTIRTLECVDFRKLEAEIKKEIADALGYSSSNFFELPRKAKNNLIARISEASKKMDIDQEKNAQILKELQNVSIYVVKEGGNMCNSHDIDFPSGEKRIATKLIVMGVNNNVEELKMNDRLSVLYHEGIHACQRNSYIVEQNGNDFLYTKTGARIRKQKIKESGELIDIYNRGVGINEGITTFRELQLHAALENKNHLDFNKKDYTYKISVDHIRDLYKNNRKEFDRLEAATWETDLSKFMGSMHDIHLEDRKMAVKNIKRTSVRVSLDVLHETRGIKNSANRGLAKAALKTLG